MKRLSVNSSLKHSALKEWLEDELENRGIDCVYARSILSLLQQDYVDVEPNECFHTRKHQSRVLYKHARPESVSYITKSKHQKGKTWGKHILASASPCKAASYDLERILKKAAVDCLKSASDYVNDIEELIDEVWTKLNIILKGEQEEIRNHTPLGRSFFIPPSPTDEMEKYFAAFPPLNSKTEKALQAGQHKILKNAWCKKCILKRSSKIRKEKALNVESQNFHSNKVMQPIIPYKSLKPIKNIFKNSRFKTPWKATCTQRGAISRTSVSCRGRGWKDSVMERNLFLTFNNLCFVDKMLLLKYVETSKAKHIVFFYDKSSLSQETLAVKSSDIKKLNELSSHMEHGESTNLISFHKNGNPEGCLNRYAQDSVNIFQSFSGENPRNDSKELLDFNGLDIHFRMSPLADLLDYKIPPIELSDRANLCYDNSYKFCTKTGAVINYLEPENPIIQKDNAFTDLKLSSHFMNESEMHSQNSIRALDIKRNLHDQIESFSISLSFNPLNTLEESRIEASFSGSKSNKHVENITSSNFENVSSDDEIYYSDEESNALYLSECNEKFVFPVSSLRQIEINSLKNCSQDTLAGSEKNDASVSDVNLHNFTFNINSEEKAISDRNEFNYEEEVENNLEILNLTNDDVNFKNIKSPYEDLPFISNGQSDCTDKNCVSEQKENEYFAKISDERESAVLNKPYNLTESSNSDISASNVAKFEEGMQKKNELNDNKWLFYWGDNDNFIARTWQEDFVPVKKDICSEHLVYDVKISTALCQEIKDEEDDLLNGLCSVPTIGDTIVENKVCNSMQNDSHSSYLTPHVEILTNCYNEQTSYVQSPDHEIAVSQVENYVPDMNNSFTFDNIENKNPMQSTDDYSLSFENNPFKAANFPDFSAFSNTVENKNSFNDYYMEGGGWSLASDSYTDYYCDNPYETSTSLCNLNLENSNGKFQQPFNRKRQHCISETTDVEKRSREETPSLYKRTKPKNAHKKRPCTYFLQGMCTRTDCRYSHDFSSTTCRFWKEGSCFKGITCPFLHGYLEEFKTQEEEEEEEEEENLEDLNDPELSYCLESETDFPSLSSNKSKEPKVQSGAINIINLKGSKKKRKGK